jgi:molybdate transport system ATP-binding protein
MSDAPRTAQPTGLAADFARQFASGPRIEGAVQMAAGVFGMVVLFGPSGAGKTTVLRCLAGLDRPDTGVIRFGEETWFDAARGIYLPPQRRGIGYLTQDYTLFPHLTVLGNVTYGLDALVREERRRRAEEMLARLELSGLADRYPRQLSGGQQQRAALARTLVRRPRLLLLDEPLSALDAPTRVQLRGELRQVLGALAVPTVMVTHDRVEALALGDTVVVMDAGKVGQTGPVGDVFSRPANVDVARVVGVETVVPAEVVSIVEGLVTLAVGSTRLVSFVGEASDWHVGNLPRGGYACIRGEEVLLAKGSAEQVSSVATSSARNRLLGTVKAVVREGPLVRVLLDCGFTLTALVTSQSCTEMALAEGDRVLALIKAPAVHFVPRG